jgi:hypothetical protein
MSDLNMFLYYTLCGIIGLLVGIVISQNNKPKCKHNWKIIEDGYIQNKNRYGETIVKGFLKVYECEHCKKLRKEQVEIN